jgi:archaellum component FlaC
MNKTITIYELLGLVKDGKAPEKINYLGIEYKFMFQDYKDESRDLYLFSEEIKDITDILNDTVEIIEDNDKLEKMQDFDLTLKETNVTKDLELTYEGVSKTFNYAWHKIDEIIDHINKLEDNQ